MMSNATAIEAIKTHNQRAYGWGYGYPIDDVLRECDAAHFGTKDFVHLAITTARRLGWPFDGSRLNELRTIIREPRYHQATVAPREVERGIGAQLELCAIGEATPDPWGAPQLLSEQDLMRLLLCCVDHFLTAEAVNLVTKLNFYKEGYRRGRAKAKGRRTP